MVAMSVAESPSDGMGEGGGAKRIGWEYTRASQSCFLANLCIC